MLFQPGQPSFLSVQSVVFQVIYEKKTVCRWRDDDKDLETDKVIADEKDKIIILFQPRQLSLHLLATEHRMQNWLQANRCGFIEKNEWPKTLQI